MKISIDVVIPSFRLQEDYIIPLLTLKVPQNTQVHYYLVVDNPKLAIPPSIQHFALGADVTLLVNHENVGVAHTRNRGIDAGTGDWILFLDDDIKTSPELLLQYEEAIRTYVNEIGFIGYVAFPPAETAFAKAIIASGSMDIFSVALRKKHFAWGATANIMLKRSAIGTTRFSDAFPKKGGGEDVDFFLFTRKRNDRKDLKTLPEARVNHPWWQDGKANFERPFRYGKGNSLLGTRHRENTYYDFLNTPETLLAGVLLLMVFLFFKPGLVYAMILFLAGVLIIEMVANFVQVYKRAKTVNPVITFYVFLLRFCQEAGVLWGKITRGRFWRIGERFHDDAKTKRINFFRLNSYKITKIVLYFLLIFWLLNTIF